MRSRVTLGVGSTMAMRRPASQLNSDDLPTLGLPTIATCGTAMTLDSDSGNAEGVRGFHACLRRCDYGVLYRALAASAPQLRSRVHAGDGRRGRRPGDCGT